MPASQQSVTPCYTTSSKSSCMNNSRPQKREGESITATFGGFKVKHPALLVWQKQWNCCDKQIVIPFEDNNRPPWATFNDHKAESRSNLPQSSPPHLGLICNSNRVLLMTITLISYDQEIAAETERESCHPQIFDRINTHPHPGAKSSVSVTPVNIPHFEMKAVGWRSISSPARGCNRLITCWTNVTHLLHPASCEENRPAGFYHFIFIMYLGQMCGTISMTESSLCLK